MSPPWARVVLGAVIGAAGVTLLGPHIARRARPAAKAALKAALAAMQEARIRGSEIAEAAEDLYAEAKAEAAAETEAAGDAAAVAEPTAATALAKINPQMNRDGAFSALTR
jgi:glucose dehydrogenase